MASSSEVASADPVYLQDPNDAPLTEEEKRQQEAAALIVQALFKGKQERIKMMIQKNAAGAKSASAARWGLIAGRFSSLRPDIDGIIRWAELSHMFLPTKDQYSSNVVLNNVSGRVHAGSMLTVTGPPGAGKTTLMRVLAKANIPGLTQGDVTFNAVSINEVPEYHRKVGYVLETCLLDGLTVYEQIMFAAKLRLNATHEYCRGRVEKVIEFMNVGGETSSQALRECTEAEKRRVAIAVELVSFPPVLLIDDPSDGLDSSSAYHIMEILSRMGQKICVITALNSGDLGDCWTTVDDLYVLSGGRLCYYGKAKDLSGWMSKAGYQVPAETNPGDHLIRLLDDTFDDFSDKTVEKMVYATYNFDLVRKMNSQSMLVTPPMSDFAAKPVPGDPPSMFAQMLMLFRRYIMDGFLNPTKYPLQILLSIALGILLGTLFQHMDNDMLKTDAKDVANLTFALTIMTITFTVRPSGVRMIAEKPVILRELAGGYYSPIAYYLVHAIFAWFESCFFTIVISVFVMGIPGMITDGPQRGDIITVNGTEVYAPGTGWIECQQSCANCAQPWFLGTDTNPDLGYNGPVQPNGCTAMWQGQEITYKSCNELINTNLVPVISCPVSTTDYQVYAHHVGILTFAAWATNSLTLFICMLSNTKDEVFYRSSVIDAIMLLFAGFLVSDREMPYMWYVFYWGSHHNYAFRMILTNELERRYVTIKTGTTVSTGGSTLPATSVDIAGTVYLQNEGFLTDDAGEPEEAPLEVLCFLWLTFCAFAYRIAAAIVIKFKYMKTVRVYPPSSMLGDFATSPADV